MLQRADDNFIYEGHPARRWKTFWLESTPLDDVRESTVPLFVAQGTRDGATLPADLFALEAVRQQPHRPLRYVVVPDGGHAFDTPDGKSHLGQLFEDFVHWALDANSPDESWHRPIATAAACACAVIHAPRGLDG